MRLSLLGFLLISFSAAAETPIVQNTLPSGVLTSAQLNERNTELKTELAALNALEKKVVESVRFLNQEMSPEDLTRRSISFLDQLSEEDRIHLEAGHPEKFGLPDKDRYQTYLAELDRWLQLHQAHHELVDQLNQEKFNYFVKQLRFYSDVTYHDLAVLKPFPISARELAKLDEDHAGVVATHENFLQQLGLYGTPKDTFRLAAIRDSFKSARKYFKRVESITSSPSEKFFSFRKKWSRFPKVFLENLKLIQLTPDAIKLGSDILFKGGGAIHQTLNKAFIKAAEIKGYRVTIHGVENLKNAQGPSEAKTVNIIAKVHRGPVLDNMVLAHLDLKDYAYVTSFGGVIPPFFSSRLKDNPGIAFVGPGFPGGIQTVTEKAIQNPTRIMVNYAEGSIGNAGETRGIAQKFSTDLIPALRAKGYQVNIIPVTSQGASFMKKDIGSDLLFGKILDARVHTAIPNSMITLLESSGRIAALGTLIRATWLSELATDPGEKGDLIQGALSVRGIERMTLKYMNIHTHFNYCHELLLKEKF